MEWGPMDLVWDLKFGPETKVMVRVRGSTKTEVIMDYWDPTVKERGWILTQRSRGERGVQSSESRNKQKAKADWDERQEGWMLRTLDEGQQGMDVTGRGTGHDLLMYCVLHFTHSVWGTKKLKYMCYSYQKMFLLKIDISNQLSFWLLLFSGNKK